MSTLPALTVQLAAGSDLTATEVETAAMALTATDVPDDIKAAFLVALATKGETVEEVAAFAAAFRARSVDPGVANWAPRAIDIVGTGGDHAGGFNISSMVVFVLACAGVTVMKHGNRGVTSKCGSADLLSALGVNLEAPPEKLRRALDQLGFVFFFAPGYHPAFKHIGPVRRALASRGQRTIFNILGPLINPGRPGLVLLGVFAEAWVDKLAGAFNTLGVQRGLAVHGVIAPGVGIDELTTATPNRVRGLGEWRDLRGHWRGEDFGFGPARFDELVGGDLSANLAIVEGLLAGRGPAGLVDTIVFNAAVALWIAGKTSSVQDGTGTARELLLGGAVKRKIAATREFYLS